MSKKKSVPKSKNQSKDNESNRISKNSAQSKEIDVHNMFNLPAGFTALSKLILKDLNNNSSSPTFYKYNKEKIANFLTDPCKNEKSIRDAVIYIYGASSHFRRLIQYFSGLSDLAYVVSPYKIDTSTANSKTVKRNYQKVLNLLSSMDIKNQFSNVLTVCLREDTFYGTLWVTNDCVILQQLPSDSCSISVIEDGVPNVSFDFSYFDSHKQYLDYYPVEFQEKYNIYTKNMSSMKWQELNSPTSFAIKCNSDILDYPLPPFAGILREIYDIEDYKSLKLTKTELENYAMLVMKLGINSDGEWSMDFDKAKEFWSNLDSVLPEEVGSVLSPMEIEKISFDKSNTGDTDTISEAEESLFSAAGVSSLLFNNKKAAASALSLSIKVDQALTYGIVKSIESAINRFIHKQSYGKNFKVTFLDCSPFNRKELGDAYIKACQLGMPMVSYYCASQGLGQQEMDCMNFLEDKVLDIKSRFIPLKSSSTMSAKDANAEGNGAGRPQMNEEDLTESGEKTRDEQ